MLRSLRGEEMAEEMRAPSESGRCTINVVQRDSAVGGLLATAAGDTLGAGYALTPPILGGDAVEMIGRGAHAPGEWTEVTATAFAIAEHAPFSDNLTGE